nr:hypothetical protein [Micromonospora sp. DSM 115978]
MSADELSRAVDLLARQVGHWLPARWAAPVPGAGLVSRAELVHGLVQRVADLAAEAEGIPTRAVPRLDNDLALLDQLRVVAADLVLAGAAPTLLAAVATEITALRPRL